MRLVAVLLCVSVGLASSIVQAQFANNTATFGVLPTTQATGTVTNNLQVTAVPNGIIVYGTWSVTIGPGIQAGTLLEFEAIRLLQTPAYGPSVFTSMSVPGSDYIIKPTGNGTTSGSGTMEIDAIPSSLVGWTFPNSGSGQYFYNNGLGFVSQSGPLVYTGGVNRYMRLKYSVDFDYNGPGGTYNFTFPLEGSLFTIPEPSSLAIALTAILGLATTRRRPVPGKAS